VSSSTPLSDRIRAAALARRERRAAIVETAQDVMETIRRRGPVEVDAFDLAYLILGPGSDARPSSPWVARAIARTLPPKELAR